MAEKTWGDFHREAVAAGMDDASACHSADKAMEAMEARANKNPFDDLPTVEEMERARVPKRSYLEALTEIQRIAADGILSNLEGTDNWNLFADIHQQVCMAVGMNPTIIPADTLSDGPSFYTSQKPDWQSIHTRPNIDDPMWFYNSAQRMLAGPRGAEPYDADNFDFWAPCVAPALPRKTP